ncbi:hypothetical protein [Rhodospirillum sp. A1_3_36]|uniref:hypothetical protein n=1 Tax=Rhodospirillum sp. A1_3_36 TaxID=3391666 RepID=UPI0039A53E15
MTRITLSALVLLAVLSACGSDKTARESEGGGLPMACAIVECDCIRSTIGIFTTEDPKAVEWTADGKASCPAGWTLRRLK